MIKSSIYGSSAFNHRDNLPLDITITQNSWVSTYYWCIYCNIKKYITSFVSCLKATLENIRFAYRKHTYWGSTSYIFHVPSCKFEIRRQIRNLNNSLKIQSRGFFRFHAAPPLQNNIQCCHMFKIKITLHYIGTTSVATFCDYQIEGPRFISVDMIKYLPTCLTS